MKEILATMLHIFVIFMMVIFVIGGILAATGAFDHWTDRYKLKRRRRRLLRSRFKDNENHSPGNPVTNQNIPFSSLPPNKATVTYKDSYSYNNHNAA